MRLSFLLLALLVGFNVLAQPTISNFSPTSGPVSTIVTINGSNFSPIAANNIIYFGAVRGVITTATSTLLKVTVPIGATYQPITVTTNGLTAYSAKPFIITFNGCGTFSSASFAPAEDIKEIHGDMYEIRINDLDGDGKPDLALSDIAEGMAFSRNISSIGNIGFSPLLRMNENSRTSFFDLSDFDGDGKADVCTTNGSSNVNILHNTSIPGTISFISLNPILLPEQVVGIKARDLDGDGKPDIVLTYSGEFNKLYILRNTSSTGAISFSQLPPIEAARLPYRIWIEDLDGDLKPELVVTNAANASVSVYRNTSTPGNITFAQRIDLPANFGPRGIAVGDLNGDGKPEIVLCSDGANTISFFVNKSIPGNISFLPQTSLATGDFPLNITLADMNGDGRPDILVKQPTDGKLYLYQNQSSNGNVSLAAPVNYSTFERSYFAAQGDLDGDGKPDIVTSENAVVLVYRNLTALGPTITADTLAATCNKNNGTVIVKGSGGTSPLQYCLPGSNFQDGRTFTGLSADNYLVKVKDASGCLDSMEVTIRQTGNPSILAKTSNASCSANNGNITVSAMLGTPPYSFSKENGLFQTGTIFNNLDSGSYKLLVKDAAGCTGDTIVKIGVNCVNLTITTSPDTCEKGIGEIKAFASMGTAPYQYIINGTTFKNTGLFTGLKAGSYTIIVRDDANIADTSTVRIDDIGVSVTLRAGNDMEVCMGEKTKLKASSDGTSFFWTPQNFLSNPAILNPEVLPNFTTQYIIKATNGACAAIDTVNVFVNPGPLAFAGNDTTIFINQSIQLNGKDLQSAGTVNYSWSPATNLNSTAIANPIATPDKDITYLLTITTFKGCKDTAVIHIKIYSKSEIYVPSAFTPNYDGINDILRAKPVGLQKFHTFTVYNRFGELVFSTTDSAKGWNGNFHSIPQPTDTYVWIAVGISYDGSIIRRKGTVTLLR